MKNPVIKLAGVLFALLFSSGCATKPQNIAATYVSEMGYMNYTCEQLAAEQSRLVAALTTESQAQLQARSNDTIGVILLGLPVSSLSGSNRAAQIARLKGELEALQKASILKNCALPKVEIAPTPTPTPAATPAAQ